MRFRNSWKLHAFSSTYAGLAAVLMILAIVTYFPGYMSPDSVVILGHARHGVTTNVYSPLMAYVWRVLDWILPGPGGMLIFQNAIYWAALAVIAGCATRNRLLATAFVLTGAAPPVFAMLGTIWKDVGMDAFLLASVAACMMALRLRRTWPIAGACVALFFACGFRQNAVVAVIPMLGMTVFCLFQIHPIPQRIVKNRLAAARYASVFLVLAASLVGAVRLVNDYKIPDSKLWSAALAHDLCGISVVQNRNYLPPYMNRNGLTIDDLKGIYSPLHANSLFDPPVRKILGIENPSDKVVEYRLTDEEARDLKLHWFTVVLDHPGSYLRHRALIADRLLVLQPRAPWYPYITDIDPNPFGLHFHRTRWNRFVTMATQYAAFSTPLYSAWVYYAIVLACGFVSFFWRFRYARIVQFLTVSVIFYFMSLFMFAMSGDFRYNIWALSCAPLCVFLLLCGGVSDSRDATQASV